MAWEKRGRRKYLYRSFRGDDGRVLKSYVGTGTAAQAAEQQHAKAQTQRRADAHAADSLAAELAPLEAMAGQLDQDVGMLVEATLRVSGFHKHQGAWRKQRG
jgi:hypothetical protein